MKGLHAPFLDGIATIKGTKGNSMIPPETLEGGDDYVDLGSVPAAKARYESPNVDVAVKDLCYRVKSGKKEKNILCSTSTSTEHPARISIAMLQRAAMMDDDDDDGGRGIMGSVE
eukprot:GHVU01170445.1.p4 GENE.GHVU01170445.1~~GHVU01170445.1.p4  ORF type:complete len:115 (-),score=23.79 GHVU01170445.1:1371-1715(-)